jgi:hypothetical protein
LEKKTERRRKEERKKGRFKRIKINNIKREIKRKER